MSILLILSGIAQIIGAFWFAVSTVNESGAMAVGGIDLDLIAPDRWLLALSAAVLFQGILLIATARVLQRVREAAKSGAKMETVVARLATIDSRITLVLKELDRLEAGPTVQGEAMVIEGTPVPER